MEGRLGPAKGKDFDTGNPMGPCLVTADEIPDPYNLTMIARVNGEEWGRGNSSSMYWKFEDLIAYIISLRDPPSRRVPRLWHGRQRLRPGAYALHQARRRDRARSRTHRSPAQSRRQLLTDQGQAGVSARADEERHERFLALRVGGSRLARKARRSLRRTAADLWRAGYGYGQLRRVSPIAWSSSAATVWRSS